MPKRVYLYAFDALMKIVDCKFLEGEAVSVRNMTRLANWMKAIYPSPVTVCAVDQRPGLYREYREAKYTSDFTKQIEFADTVMREGIQLV